MRHLSKSATSFRFFVFPEEGNALLCQSQWQGAHDFARQHTKIKVRAITRIKLIVVVIVSISSPLTMTHFRRHGDETRARKYAALHERASERASDVGTIERK